MLSVWFGIFVMDSAFHCQEIIFVSYCHAWVSSVKYGCRSNKGDSSRQIVCRVFIASSNICTCILLLKIRAESKTCFKWSNQIIFDPYRILLLDAGTD